MSGELPVEGAARAGRGGIVLVAVLLVAGAVGLRWARGESLAPKAVVQAVKDRVDRPPPMFPPTDDQVRPAGGDAGVGDRLKGQLGALRQRVVARTPDGPEVGEAGRQRALELPEQTPQVAADLVQRILPYVTEGGVAFLLGIALGVATKAAAKLMILLAFLSMLGVGYFAQQGVLAVDQVALVDWLRRFVLNAGEHQDAVAALKAKLPAFGSLGAGYLLGLRR